MEMTGVTRPISTTRTRSRAVHGCTSILESSVRSSHSLPSIDGVETCRRAVERSASGGHVQSARVAG